MSVAGLSRAFALAFIIPGHYICLSQLAVVDTVDQG